MQKWSKHFCRRLSIGSGLDRELKLALRLLRVEFCTRFVGFQRQFVERLNKRSGVRPGFGNFTSAAGTVSHCQKSLLAGL